MKIRNLLNQKFNRLTVIAESGRSSSGKVMWLCRCDCGKTKIVRGTELTGNKTTSCGCYQAIAGRKNKKDLSGKRFGKLVVIKDSGERMGPNIKWLCKCDCGKETIVAGGNLTHGHTMSCGCFGRYMHTKHGMTGTPEYACLKTRKRKEKKLLLDSMWTPEMEEELVSFFKSCVVCGEVGRLATDHVKPLSKGNGLYPGNAVRLCRHCNSVKHNRDLAQLDSNMRSKIGFSANLFAEHWNNLMEVNHG